MVWISSLTQSFSGVVWAKAQTTRKAKTKIDDLFIKFYQNTQD